MCVCDIIMGYYIARFFCLSNHGILVLQYDLLVGFVRSYHDGEHYNSVRLKEDSCEGPARPIVIKVLYLVFLFLSKIIETTKDTCTIM